MGVAAAAACPGMMVRMPPSEVLGRAWRERWERHRREYDVHCHLGLMMSAMPVPPSAALSLAFMGVVPALRAMVLAHGSESFLHESFPSLPRYDDSGRDACRNALVAHGMEIRGGS